MSDRVQFSKRGSRDVERLDSGSRRRVRKILDGLRRDEPPPNLDVRPLAGHPPWLRLRVGDMRVIFRPLTTAELRRLGLTARGYLIERVVNRRDLDEAVRPL